MSGHFGGNPYAWKGGANAPHISRYFLARGWVMPEETVLDAACGNGYGTHLLSLVAKKAIGYEVDEGCIACGNNNWLSDNTEFKVMDLNTCELPDVDVTVSIESMEHVDDLKRFVEQIKKHTRRLIVFTVPIGGTTQAYKDEKPGPHTEKHDFFNDADADKLIQDDVWKKQTGFRFGYSYFGVFFKKEPVRIK